MLHHLVEFLSSINVMGEFVTGSEGSLLPAGDRVSLEVKDGNGLWRCYGTLLGASERHFRIKKSREVVESIEDVIKERDELKAKLAKIQEAIQ